MKTSKTIAGVLIALTLTSTILLTSCKKEEKEPEPTPAPTPAPAPAQTNTQKITGKAWKTTAATVDPAYNVGGTMITDWYSQMPACSKDDLMTLNSNGTYTEDEGASKCDPSDPQVTTGTWVWNSNETIITITENGASYNYEIVQNDGTTLKYKQSEIIGGINYVLTVTCQKQ